MCHHRPLQLKPLSESGQVDGGADEEGHGYVDDAAVLAQQVHRRQAEHLPLPVLHGEAGQCVVEADVVSVTGHPVPVKRDASVNGQGSHLKRFQLENMSMFPGDSLHYSFHHQI